METRNEKGQGSLEYLIIVAAVLAIAAVVVLFLSGAFSSTAASGDLAKCKQQASSCSASLIGAVSTTCSNASCNACTADISASSSTVATLNTSLKACTYGRPDLIVAP